MATVTELEQELSLYKTARDKILSGQEYSIGGRSVRRPDLASIEARIRELENRLTIAQNGGRINTQQAVFGGKRG